MYADGWINCDTDPQWRVPHPALLWPTLQGKLDLIVANHVLQMVPWPQLVPFLLDCHSALRPGGILRLLVPDTEAAIGALMAEDADWFPISDEHETSVDGKFCMYLSQAGATRSVFTSDWLLELLRRAGFRAFDVVGPGVTRAPADWEAMSLDSRESESIIVEAIR